jgi:hypothetical protein
MKVFVHPHFNAMHVLVFPHPRFPSFSLVFLLEEGMVQLLPDDAIVWGVRLREMSFLEDFFKGFRPALLSLRDFRPKIVLASLLLSRSSHRWVSENDS